MLSLKKVRFVGWVVVSLFWGSVVKAADLELVGREMVRMLQDGHYARLPFNEQMSARFLERYLTQLDDQRVYFLEAEVVDIRRRFERRLHDLISTRQVMPVANMIFERYRQRVIERVRYSRKQLEASGFTFEEDRRVVRDRAEAEWAKTPPELEKLWQERLELMILDELVRRKRLQGRALEKGRDDPFRDQGTVESVLAKKFGRQEQMVRGMGAEDVAALWFSAIANSYDPHSDYLSENEMAQFQINVSNELVGIGARLEMNDDGETVVKGLMRDGPAERTGGLQIGDRIFEVSARNNGKWQDITFKPLDKVIEFVLGEEGVSVGLRFRRRVGERDEVLEIAIPRGVVTIKEELAGARIYQFDTVSGGGKVAVLTIPSFYFDFGRGGSRVSVHVEQLLTRLNREGVTGLVLDLRGNSGGSLPEVQRLTGYFVGRGPVVQVRSSNGQILSLESFHEKPLFDGSLVVLTDKKSASATEILAGALQDYHRAVLVGESSTFGKGTVQKTNDIADFMPVFADRAGAGWLKLTFQKYYRVSGSSVQIEGVIPDLILPKGSGGPELGEGGRKYALPHDVIRASGKFKPEDRAQLFLPTLREASAARLAVQTFFTGIEDEDPSEIGDGMVSLNLAIRMMELNERETRRAARELERKAFFERIRAEDENRFKVFRLSLDDLERESLPVDDGEAGQGNDGAGVEDELAVLEGKVIWPGGIDAYEREAVNVLRDLMAARAVVPPVVRERD